MTDSSQEVARRQRELAQRALVEAAAVSARLLNVHRRALTLLGGDGDTPVPEEIGARMRVIEKRMIEVEKLMRDAEQDSSTTTGCSPPTDEERR